jgi:uncharacterized hydantoinase/oxoprolinase family protein
MHDHWLVFGGEIVDLQMEALTIEDVRDTYDSAFRDPTATEYVGTFKTREAAQAAWKARAWATVDNALMRFFIVGMDSTLLPPIKAPFSSYFAENQRG